jgi:hypothetical protein
MQGEVIGQQLGGCTEVTSGRIQGKEAADKGFVSYQVT